MIEVARWGAVAVLIAAMGAAFAWALMAVGWRKDTPKPCPHGWEPRYLCPICGAP